MIYPSKKNHTEVEVKKYIVLPTRKITLRETKEPFFLRTQFKAFHEIQI